MDLRASMDKVYIIGRDEIPSVICVEEAQSISLSFVALPGVSADIDVSIRLLGPGANADLRGVFVCSDAEKININLRMDHQSPRASSNQLFKAIVGGKSRLYFDGLIYVAKDAQKTDAFQQVHSLLLSKEAMVESRPQLEIYADDVQCTHGATSGALNSEQLFYMRSRGVAKEDAERFQKIAFLAPVVEHLSEELKEEIYATL